MKILLIILTMFFVSCVNHNSRNTVNKDGSFIGIEGQYSLIEGIDFVVLPYDENNGWLAFEKGISIKLTVNDLENINELLQSAVNNYNANKESLWKGKINLKNYKRQYVAIINSKMEKEVFINCFNSKLIEEYFFWEKELVIVDDGGNNFFNVKINLGKMIYYDFSVNGHANIGTALNRTVTVRR